MVSEKLLHRHLLSRERTDNKFKREKIYIENVCKELNCLGGIFELPDYLNFRGLKPTRVLKLEEYHDICVSESGGCLMN